MGNLNWKYSGKADVNIAEKRKVPIKLILLILLLVFIVTAATVGIIKRHYIIDKFKNPYFQLIAEELEVDVNSELDYSSVLGENNWPERYEIIYPDLSKINTNKVGEYNVEFILVTSATSNSTPLCIRVIDKTPPEIKLKETSIMLHRGEETDKFKPESFIESVTDNYDKKEDIDIIYPATFDWTKDVLEVNYSAIDTSGNTGVAKLIISIENEKLPKSKIVINFVDINNEQIDKTLTLEEDIATPYKVEVKEIKGYKFKEISKDSVPLEGEFTKKDQEVILVYEKIEESKEEKTEENKNNSEESNNNANSQNTEKPVEDSNNTSSSNESSSSNTHETSSENSSSEPTSPPAPKGHYIEGVGDFSVKKGTSLQTFIQMLQTGVYSDEEVQVLFGAVSQESLNTPGKYTVTYKTAHVTKDITVTVTN